MSCFREIAFLRLALTRSMNHASCVSKVCSLSVVLGTFSTIMLDNKILVIFLEILKCLDLICFFGNMAVFRYSQSNT